MMLRQVINSDCLEVLKELPDNYADLCLTDIPYGINVTNMSFTKGSKSGVTYGTNFIKYDDWDKKTISKEVLNQILRVSKNQIIFGGNYISDILPTSRCWLIWDKRLNEKYDGLDQADCEMAWTSFNKPSRIIRYLWVGMIQGDMKNKEKRYHPTQKPLPVFEKIISNYTKEGDVVIDPFLGSGTTAVICEKLRRKWLGIEINKDYCDISNKRLEKWINQTRLS